MSRPNTIDAVMHEIHLGHTGQSCGCAWCANDPFCWDCDHCTELDNAPCAGDSVDDWAAWNVPCDWCETEREKEDDAMMTEDELRAWLAQMNREFLERMRANMAETADMTPEEQAYVLELTAGTLRRFEETMTVEELREEWMDHHGVGDELGSE